MLDLDSCGEHASVELVLHALELQVADQHPGQCAPQEQAHGDDARGGRQEAKSESQLPPSSSR
jgi:hypothetical protein